MKPSRALVDGVDPDQPSSGGLTGGNGFSQYLSQQAGAEAAAMGHTFYGQAGDQDHARGIRRQASHQLAGAAARRTEPVVTLK